MRLDELEWDTADDSCWDVAKITSNLYVIRSKNPVCSNGLCPVPVGTYAFRLPDERGLMSVYHYTDSPIVAQCVLLDLLEKEKGRRENHQPDAPSSPPGSTEEPSPKSHI